MARPDVVFVAQLGARVDAPIKYGAMRALLETGRRLAESGRRTTLLGIADVDEGDAEGLPFIGAPNETALRRAVRRLKPRAVVGCSRADVLVAHPAAAGLVYQHGPHAPDGDFAVPIIRSLRTPVVVVSRDSRDLQVKCGVPASQLHVVPNGFDASTFRTGSESRRERRLVFAGHGVSYKGLDIAVAAFSMLRREFPDAELHIYGSTHSWARSAHVWPAEWLDDAARPDWPKIEADVPGLRWRGEGSPPELAVAFRSSGLLVMPSRIAETFGIVSVEAQACGCIPVLPLHGGFPETMVPGETGYLYEENTVEGLAEAVARLWREGRPAEEQRRMAAEWVRATFSWDDAAGRIGQLLDQAAGRDPWRARWWASAAQVKRSLRSARDAVRATRSPSR